MVVLLVVSNKFGLAEHVAQTDEVNRQLFPTWKIYGTVHLQSSWAGQPPEAVLQLLWYFFNNLRGDPPLQSSSEAAFPPNSHILYREDPPPFPSVLSLLPCYENMLASALVSMWFSKIFLLSRVFLLFGNVSKALYTVWYKNDQVSTFSVFSA